MQLVQKSPFTPSVVLTRVSILNCPASICRKIDWKQCNNSTYWILRVRYASIAKEKLNTVKTISSHLLLILSIEDNLRASWSASATERLSMSLHFRITFPNLWILFEFHLSGFTIPFYHLRWLGSWHRFNSMPRNLKLPAEVESGLLVPYLLPVCSAEVGTSVRWISSIPNDYLKSTSSPSNASFASTDGCLIIDLRGCWPPATASMKKFMIRDDNSKFCILFGGFYLNGFTIFFLSSGIMSLARRPKSANWVTKWSSWAICLVRLV